MGAILVAAGVVAAVPAPAVVILDSTWREEGGRPGREAAGFGAHVRLAGEPQFRALLSVSYDDGASWGDGSATWIGNARGHGYALTSAHLLDDAEAGTMLFRTDGGRTLHGERAWVHPDYNPVDDRTGVDAAIIRLSGPVEDAGEPPVLYAGGGEAGRVITFVGFGTRGVASLGEDERFLADTGKAAAQGLVEEAAPLRRLSAGVEEPGNYLTVFLPREDGRLDNPFGGPRRPVSRLAGLLGSGDSGGSAWMPMGEGWVVVGINTSGDGEARYGDHSWFVRVSGLRPWIRSVFPDARFAGDGEAVAAARPVEPAPVPTAVPTPIPGTAPGASPGTAPCRERERFFVFSDGAWYPARVRGPGPSAGACRVGFDGYGRDEDESVAADRMVGWAAEGPGEPLSVCRRGVAVIAEEDGVWYPGTVARERAKGCVVRYDDTDYEDETLPLSRLRVLR